MIKVLTDLSGGRNGIDSPVSDIFPDNQCADGVNVDWRNGGLGRRRGGSYDVLANSTVDAFTLPIYSLIRHLPSGDETAGEMWAFEGTTTQVQKLAAGTVWSAAIAAPYLLSDIPYISGVSFNSALYLFQRSAAFATEDRSLIYDSFMGLIRYTGLKAPAAPVISNTGGGAYAAVLRYYRVRWSDSNSTRVSEPSSNSAFTPSGAGTAARITRPALIVEGETNWIIEASTDGVTFYLLTTQTAATTFYDDSAATTTYSAGTLSAVLGTYTLIPRMTVGVADGNRLIMSVGSRVYYTPILGTLNLGDAERIFQTATAKPYIDLNTRSGGDITAIGQINGVVYAFKYKQIWRLTPTGDPNAPYSARRISGIVGAVNQKCLELGEDSFGNPCLYFMTSGGPYRVGPVGIQYLGRDIEDLTYAINGDCNINTAANLCVSHSTFYANLGQWWLWFASGTSNFPNNLVVLDVEKAQVRDEYGARGGWSRFTGEMASAMCSAQGNATLAANGILKPWVGVYDAASPIISIADRNDILSDRGTGFQAFVTTKSLVPPEELGTFAHLAETLALILSNTAGTLTIRQKLFRDFQVESSSSDVTVPIADQGTRVFRLFSGSMLADCYAIQARIGDVGVATCAWQIDALSLHLTKDGDGT